MFKTSCAGRDYGSHNITKKRKEENKMKKKVLLASLLCSVSFCFSPVNVFAEDDSISQIENGDGVATFGDWYENEYVDDFGDSTGKIFCASICQGTFENTATSEEDLAVVVFYEPRKESLTFRLLEYENKKATYLDSDEIAFKYKIDKKTGECTPKSSAPNGDLELTGEDSKALIDALMKGSDVKIVIYIGSSKYNFSINGNGFSDAHDDAEKKIEEIGIAGVYYSTKEDGSDYFEITPETDTQGTILYYDEGISDTEEDTITVNYTYDTETHLLTFDSSEITDWNGIEELLLVDDYCVKIKDKVYEGTVPDGNAFDLELNWSSRKPDNQASGVLTFHKDLTWEYTSVAYDGSEGMKQHGAYLRNGSELYMITVDKVCYTSFIYEGKYYDGLFEWSHPVIYKR